MIDHMTFRVADMVRTRAFYAAALAPLGYRVQFEGNFDGAFVIDPDGNNIEAVCHDAPACA